MWLAYFFLFKECQKTAPVSIIFKLKWVAGTLGGNMDEIEKMNKPDQSSLLNLMESGTLSAKTQATNDN
jgi:hypothetical protein